MADMACIAFMLCCHMSGGFINERVMHMIHMVKISLVYFAYILHVAEASLGLLYAVGGIMLLRIRSVRCRTRLRTNRYFQ